MSCIIKNLVISTIAGIVFSSDSSASLVVFDDFNDGVFDTSKWSSDLPFPESSFTESGGKLNLNNRAIISTNDTIQFPITISASFMASQFDIVRILTRSDLQVENSYFHELNGLRFSFHYQDQAIRIQDSDSFMVDQKPFVLNAGQVYDVFIQDDGSNVSLFIDGVMQLSGVSNYSGGDYISFYNREVNRGWAIPSSASFDYFSVARSPVPEPANTFLPVACFAAVAFQRRNRR